MIRQRENPLDDSDLPARGVSVHGSVILSLGGPERGRPLHGQSVQRPGKAARAGRTHPSAGKHPARHARAAGESLRSHRKARAGGYHRGDAEQENTGQVRGRHRRKLHDDFERGCQAAGD